MRCTSQGGIEHASLQALRAVHSRGLPALSCNNFSQVDPQRAGVAQQEREEALAAEARAMAPRLRARPPLAAPLAGAAGWALGAAAAALPGRYGAAITSAPTARAAGAWEALVCAVFTGHLTCQCLERQNAWASPMALFIGLVCTTVGTSPVAARAGSELAINERSQARGFAAHRRGGTLGSCGMQPGGRRPGATLECAVAGGVAEALEDQFNGQLRELHERAAGGGGGVGGGGGARAEALRALVRRLRDEPRALDASVKARPACRPGPLSRLQAGVAQLPAATALAWLRGGAGEDGSVRKPGAVSHLRLPAKPGSLCCARGGDWSAHCRSRHCPSCVPLLCPPGAASMPVAIVWPPGHPLQVVLPGARSLTDPPVCLCAGAQPRGGRGSQQHGGAAAADGRGGPRRRREAGLCGAAEPGSARVGC